MPPTVEPSVMPTIWPLFKGAICGCVKLSRGKAELRPVRVAEIPQIEALRAGICTSEMPKAERRSGAYLVYGTSLIGRLQLVMWRMNDSYHNAAPTRKLHDRNQYTKC